MSRARRWGSLNLRPLGNEVCEYLGLNSTTWCVRYVLPHQLEHPLGDSAFGLGVLDDLREWVFGHHGDGVRVEVVSELALGHQNRVHELLHLRVTRRGVGEHLAEKYTGRCTFCDLPGSSRSTTSAALTT
jgi:hypothetical protein